MELLRYVDANAEKFCGEDDALAKIPAVATSLLQMSGIVCTHASLAATMGLYAIVDTVDLAVSQTEMGDYATMFEANGPLGLGGKSDVGIAATMTTGIIHKLLADSNVNLEWLDSDSVVLQTGPVMRLVTRFATGECARQQAAGGAIELAQDARSSHVERASQELLSHVTEHGAHQLALRVCATSNHFHSHGQSALRRLDTQKEQVSLLLRRLLQSHKVDYRLALGCMVALPKETAVTAFKEQLKRERSHREFKRLRELAKLGVDVSRTWQNPSTIFEQDCINLQLNARWWQQFTELLIKFDYAAFQPRDQSAADSRLHAGLRKFVKPLLQKTNFDLSLAREFCSDYNLADPSLAFIELVLLLPATERPNYRAEVETVLRNAVVDNAHLADTLEYCVPRLSGIDYEKLMFALEMLRSARPERSSEFARKVKTLQILQRFYGEHTDIASSLRAGRERIDFHALLNDPWKVLRPELDLESVFKLSALAVPLQIHHDEFYVQLVQILFKKGEDDKASDENSAAETRLPDMEEVSPLLLAFRYPPVATKCAEWVSTRYADGANKLAALEVAVACAQRWSEGELNGDATCASPEAQDESSPKPHPSGAQRVRSGEAFGAQRVCSGKPTLRRLQGLAANAFTALQLTKIEDLLGTDGIRDMLAIAKPQQMIQQLYGRFAIAAFKSERFKNVVSDHHALPTLHSVVEAIATRHEVDVSRMKRKMLEQWLTADRATESEHFDSKAVSIFQPTPRERATEVDTALAMRIVYILSDSTRRNASASSAPGDAPTEGGSQLKGALTLLQHATNKAKASYTARLRALRALFILVPKSDIARLYKQLHDKPLADLMEYWQLCLLMTEFEDLRLGIHSIEELRSRDKRELVQGLWRNHRQSAHKGRILQLIVTLMVDYAIHDSRLWCAVIRQLQEYAEHRFLLLHVLPTIAGSPVLCQHLGADILPLWQSIVTSPIDELCSCLQQQDVICGAGKGARGLSLGLAKEHVNHALSQVVALLQRCPFASDIGIDAMASRLFSAGGKAFAKHALRIAHTIPDAAQRAAAAAPIVQCLQASVEAEH
eukprot:g115.t1